MERINRPIITDKAGAGKIGESDEESKAPEAIQKLTNRKTQSALQNTPLSLRQTAEEGLKGAAVTTGVFTVASNLRLFASYGLQLLGMRKTVANPIAFATAALFVGGAHTKIEAYANGVLNYGLGSRSYSARRELSAVEHQQQMAMIGASATFWFTASTLARAMFMKSIPLSSVGNVLKSAGQTFFANGMAGLLTGLTSGCLKQSQSYYFESNAAPKSMEEAEEAFREALNFPHQATDKNAVEYGKILGALSAYFSSWALEHKRDAINAAISPARQKYFWGAVPMAVFMTFWLSAQHLMTWRDSAPNADALLADLKDAESWLRELSHPMKDQGPKAVTEVLYRLLKQSEAGAPMSLHNFKGLVAEAYAAVERSDDPTRRQAEADELRLLLARHSIPQDAADELINMFLAPAETPAIIEPPLSPRSGSDEL